VLAGESPGVATTRTALDRYPPEPWTQAEERRRGHATFEFDDQSDAVPQPLRLRKYWAGPLWKAPHQVLSST
jgi:hypothetical protein